MLGFVWILKLESLRKNTRTKLKRKNKIKGSISKKRKRKRKRLYISYFYLPINNEEFKNNSILSDLSFPS